MVDGSGILSFTTFFTIDNSDLPITETTTIYHPPSTISLWREARVRNAFLTGFPKKPFPATPVFGFQPLPLPSFHKTSGCGDLRVLKQVPFSRDDLVNVKKTN